MKKQLLILMILFTAVMGYSQNIGDQFINDSILYEITSITSNTVEIKSSSNASVAGGNIAATVDNNTITYSVTSIGVNAFLNNPQTSVTIPDSVVNIDSGAFSGSPSLTCVISQATQPPTVTTNNSPTDSFGIERSNIDLSIPSGTSSAYAAAGWTGFKTVAAGLTGTFVVENITYQINATANNEVTITDYDTAGGTSVIIPASVSSGCTDFSVTDIGLSAFVGDNLTSISIPSSIINIGTAAFAQNQLVTVDIPDSVLTIGWNAFTQNPLLENLDLGNGVETIGEDAFSSTSISSVTIPSSVVTIGETAFAYNSFLTCVISEATTPPTITTNNTGTDTFSGNRSTINLTIPSGTASAYAAAQWTGFNSVAEGLTGTFVVNSISYEINATSLNEVTITDYNSAGGTIVNILPTVARGCTNYSVTAIGNQAFFQNGLTSVIIPDSVTTIGTAAFRGNNFTSFTIPDSVVTIDNAAFRDNSLMTNLTLGSNIISIGQEVFAFNDLQSLTIPDSVLTIGNGAFAQNPNLVNISIGNNVASIGDLAFAYAFITNITIPASVTTIGSNAFLNNILLVDVTSLGTAAPTITTGTNDTFGSIANRGNIDLHIPPNSTGAYVTDTGALWTDFMTVTEDALLSTSELEILSAIKVISTADGLEIKSSNNVQLQNYTVYAITGAKVKTGTEPIITTNTFSNGIYILKLDFDKGTVVKKFAK